MREVGPVRLPGSSLSMRDIPRNITIVGPGALGCLLGASMARAGLSVTLLDHRPERARVLNDSGITVYDGDRTWKANPAVTAQTHCLGPQDVVIILVKAYQTASAIKAVIPLLGPGSLLLSLQNGLGADEMLTALSPSTGVAIGATSQGATLVRDGVVRHAGEGNTTVGLITSGQEARHMLERTVEAFNLAGWPCSMVRDIYPVIWKKLLVNVGINALTALTGMKNGELLDHEETVAIQETLVREGYTVAEEAGIHIGMDFTACLDQVRQVCRATAANRSSMLQDRMQGRPTEIDYINGAVCRIARGLGLKTPVNDTVTGLVKLFNADTENLPNKNR